MPGKTIGYARTAMSGQDISPQVEALRAAGCTEIFTDIGVSGITLNRPGLLQVLRVLESGDTLKVASLDRIARSLAAFAEFRAGLGERGIHIVMLDTGITTTPTLAEIAMSLMAAVAESELN